jgi:hypothetical protein
MFLVPRLRGDDVWTPVSTGVTVLGLFTNLSPVLSEKFEEYPIRETFLFRAKKRVKEKG